MAWGLAAMTVAELEYIEDSSMPSWLNLTEGVFQAQVARWDTGNCNGGLRWQIWPYQNGYNTKDATSNGGLFQLSVRLARYTKNQTYSYGAYISGAAYMYSVKNGEKSKWDGTVGIEEQMSATSLFASNLIAFEHMHITTQNTSTSTAQNMSSTPTGTQGEATRSTTKVHGGNHPLRSWFGSAIALVLFSGLV
ncbi:Six-hairpin glycosidase [Penicillium cf. viridicatum]|uniref:mannan endo-1,6-alpha-mannosidase n=1 Tax=Penicillium cf. viridicatum TaxID=2972119 RepID=A0A9W9MLP3_9EURO|nr:Six-hairpin glycosidase [Penicillium cf. viridicatum]